MIIIFYGLHSSDWMNILNTKLISYFADLRIDNVINVHNVNDLDKRHPSFKYVVIPLMESHMIELHNHNISALMPKLEDIKIFSCKKLFSTYVKNNNLEQYTPKIYNLNDDVPNDMLYIIKPYSENNGQGMKIKNNICADDFENQIVQEYINNTLEYTSYIVSKNGVIKKCITYAYSFDDEQHIKIFPINTTKMLKYDLEDKYIKILELFLLPCEYTGMCNINFIIHEGQVKVFEINPRLGGGLMKSDKHDLADILAELIKCNQSS